MMIKIYKTFMGFSFSDLSIGVAFERLMSETPYLIEETSIAPYITGCGVLLVGHGFRSSPFNRNLSSLRHVVMLFF